MHNMDIIIIHYVIIIIHYVKYGYYNQDGWQSAMTLWFKVETT